MSPPSWVLLAGLTGERRYLEHMAKEFKVTTAKLFNRKAGLFYRDSTYLPGGSNHKGRDIYWSRGNGWVFGALAMILRDLPADFADRKWFESLFREMARGIAARQQPDGSWHPDLANPKSPDCPEMSGTSFFVLGIDGSVVPTDSGQTLHSSMIREKWETSKSPDCVSGLLI